MAGRVVGTGKTVKLTCGTSGIDSGEAAELVIFKKSDDSQLDSLQSKVKDNVIAADWTAKGPGPDDKEQGWEVYYKAKCKGLETKAQPLTVYTDWVEVTSVDADGKSIADAAFRLSVDGAKPRDRTTGTSGVRKEEHLPPGKVKVQWLKPWRLIEWVDADGPKRKAKVEKVPPAVLVWPPKGTHSQWVNLAADTKKPELGSKLKVKVRLVGGKKGAKVYAKLVFDEKANSKRNSPKPGFTGGVSADWCKQGGVEGTLRDDDGKPNCEAELELELGLAGGDQFTVWVGGSKDCDDESVAITNWRRVYHQVTKPKSMKLHDRAVLKAALKDVFLEYEEYKKVDIDEADSGIPAGSFMDGGDFGKPGKKLLNIGDHNATWFRGKFDDTKAPLGAHVMFCDKQYDGGTAGAWHEQELEVETTTDTTELAIKDGHKFDVFTKAIQDGNSSVLSGSTWKSLAPSGHPMSGKSGDITAAMVTVDATTHGHIKVKLPAGTAGKGDVPKGKTATDAVVKHKVKLKVKLRVARGPFLGESSGVHQLIVLTPNVKAFNAVLVHELAHSLRQTIKEVAPGLSKADHKRHYTGHGHQGDHCATGLSDDDYAKADYRALPLGTCVMYGAASATQDPPGDAGKFCDACRPFMRADHCQSLVGAAAAKADEVCGPEGPTATVAEPSLNLISVNGGQGERFAPGAETLDLGFEMVGMENEPLVLEVDATGHANPVYRRELTSAEKGTGSFVVAWRGDTTCPSGALAGRHIDPLHGPYRVKLLRGDQVAAEVDIQVLYHSLELRFAPHAATRPPEAERVKWFQWKLNEMGYDAGPVDGTSRDSLTRAIARFQRAHYAPGTTTILTENGDINDDATFRALRAQNPARDHRIVWEPGKDPLREDCKYLQRDNYLCDRGQDFVTTNLPQFDSMDRKAHAEDKMDRGFVALEARVLLVGKRGAAVWAPQAVGPVKVAFEVRDSGHNLGVVRADVPARTFVARTYVQRALQFGGNGTADVSIGTAVRIDQTAAGEWLGDNCPTTHGGYRAATAQANCAAHFPADADNRLAPWAAPTYGTETRGALTFHRALVPAFQGPVGRSHEYDGRAGLYFRMSTKAGDSFKLRAALDFSGLERREELTTAHQPHAATLVRETGTWTVWRHTRVSAFCRMTAPATRPQPNWATVRAWWNDAFLEVADQGAPKMVLDYATVVTEAAYKAAITGLPASHRPPDSATADRVTYRGAAGLYGGPPIDQAPGESAADYVRRAGEAMFDWVAGNDNAVVNKVLSLLHAKARETSPEGFVYFDYRVHPPISGRDDDGAGGWVATADPSAQDFVFMSDGANKNIRGWVRVDGAVTLCVDNDSNVDNYILHESGHARFLYHHRNAGDANPNHHDADHDRCGMSYRFAGEVAATKDYPLCGKCLLRLRGWDVLKLPNRFTA